MVVTKNYQGELAQQLGEYRGHGQKEASNHRPPTDSTKPDQYEAALESNAEKWILDEQRLFDITVSDVDRTLVECQQKTRELETKVDQLLSDTSLFSTVESDFSAERQSLISYTAARMRAEVDWRHFRATNNITEQPVYPESRWYHSG
jgi:hypothetical protein